MPPTLLQATEEHEAAVRALFVRAGAPVRDMAWARAFAEDFPQPATPWMVPAESDPGDPPLAFVLVHPRRLHSRGEVMDAQVLTDFVAAEGPDGEQAARDLLDGLADRASVTFAAGWGQAGMAALRRLSWRHVANWPRLRFPAGEIDRRRKPLPPPPSGAVSADPAPMNALLEEGGRSFFIRPPELDRRLGAFDHGAQKLLVTLASDRTEQRTRGSAYLRLDQAPGSLPGSTEWHLADERLAPEDHAAAAAFLAALARNGGQAVYLSVLDEPFVKAAVREGAEHVSARWALFCRFRDASFRELALEFNALASWHFTPADFDLDLDR